MEKSQKIFRTAAIIHLILASIVFFNTYSLFGIVAAVVLFYFSKLTTEELLKMKTGILIFSIATIPLNLIPSILSIVGCVKLDEENNKQNGINAPPVKIKRVVDPEMRKIDILLKLGVGMVFISGILFATTSWDFLTDAFKAVGLLFFGSIFLGLSLFVERKLNLYRSSYMYWILSMSFYLLSIVAILYFGVMGSIMYEGVKAKLAYGITCFTAAGLFYATYLKFPKEYLLYGFYGSAFLVIYNFLAYAIAEPAIVMILLCLVLCVALVLSKKDTVLYQISKIISMTMFVFIFRSIEDNNSALILVASLINAGSILYLIHDESFTAETVINILIFFLLIFVSIYNLDVLYYDHLLVFSLLSIFTLLLKTNIIKTNKVVQHIQYAYYSLAAFFLMIASAYDSESLAFAISAAYLLMNVISSLDLETNNVIKIAPFMEPASIMATIALFFAIPELNINISTSNILLIGTFIYAICHYFYKTPLRKRIYFITSLIGIVSVIEASNVDREILPALAILIPSIYILGTSAYEYKTENKRSVYLIIAYGIFLLGIYNILRIANVFAIPNYIADILFAVFLVAILLLWDQDLIKKINYFAIVVPLISLVNDLSINHNWEQIMMSISILYCTFLLIHFWIKEDSTKNIAGIFGVIIAVIMLLDIENLYSGISIGIIGLGTIALGYQYKYLKSFFLGGIIITVLNILYQLREVWEDIPFWLYLLVGGLAIIGFVTYKEMKKK